MILELLVFNAPKFKPLDQPEPVPIDPPIICSYSDYIHHRHLSLSPKADNQFIIPRRVEG